MPNIQSAMKRMRSDAAKRARNAAVLSELKTLDKKLLALAQDPAKAEPLARFMAARYDRAVSRGIIPQGRADRKKSRIAKFIAKIKK
jgi:small subunit ribosomal protein S20